MIALDKIDIAENWITLVLLLLLVSLFFLKKLQASKLEAYLFRLFNKGFVESECEENNGFFKLFYWIIFLFSVTVLSLITHRFFDFFLERDTSFIFIFFLLLLYFLLKWLLEYLLSMVFVIRKEVRFFLVSKKIYLYSISFYLFFCFILLQYTSFNVVFLAWSTGILFFLRFSFHIGYNKNLVINKLFYFILYICTLEIVPLLILFKLVF